MKKINLQKILLIFIILLPLLDILSFEFRNIFGTSKSPSTFIRPLIPAIVFIAIFFKNKFKIKTICISLCYCLYAIMHLFIFEKYITGISFGTPMHELQYIINYTFNILTFFVFLFVFYKTDVNSLKKSIIITCSIYVFSIYLSIITNTYTSTYIEGIGIKGWFESGNSLSTTLILGLFIILSLFNTGNKKIYLVILISLCELFLLLLLGTRTAMFGGLIVAILYIIFTVFYQLKNRIKISKKMIVFFLIIIGLILTVIFILGSKTIERRKYLSSFNANIDVYTGNTLHVTADIADINNKANNDLYPDNFLSIQEKQAFNSLYEFANKKELSCTNRRVQQLMYNIYLVKYQKNIFAILFGNGLLNNFGELVLELELPAFIINFGIIGFVLFFVPYLSSFVYALYQGYKYRKSIDIEYLMLISGLLFAFASACFTGVTFFNTSSATFVTLIVLLLNHKIQNFKQEKNK